MKERIAPNIAEWLAATRDQLARGIVHDRDFAAFARYRSFRDRARVVMDIGANRGQSIASFLAVLPEVRIHAFEANPVFYDVLGAIAEECAGRVCVHPFGLGGEAGSVTFYLPSGGGLPFLEEASMRREYFDLPWVKKKFEDRGGLSLESIEVTVRSGDSLGLRPDIIKIDVEGAEAEVLSGLVETIRARRPVLLVENSDWHTVTGLLAGLGYEPYRFLEEERTLVPFFGETTNTFYIEGSQVPNLLAG